MPIDPATEGDDTRSVTIPEFFIYDGLGGADTLTVTVGAPLMTISGDATAASIFALEAGMDTNLRLQGTLTSVERVVVDAGENALIDGSEAAIELELSGRGLLIGGSANDVLRAIPGTVATALKGGAGNDTFIIKESSLTGPVFITDFSAGDVIQMGGYANAPGATPVAIASRRVRGQTILEADGNYVVLTNGAYRMQIDSSGNITIASVVSMAPTAKAGESADAFVGTASDDILAGKGGDDRLVGDAGNDRLVGGLGNDFLSGGAGDDLLQDDGGSNTMFGGAGADRIIGGLDRDLSYGGEGDDQIYGNGGDDVLQGDGGADLLNGGDGNDRLGGGDAEDRLYGVAGDDRLSGGDGDDRLNGGTGNDILIGGEGEDILRGNEDNDLLIGNAGNDDLQGGDGDDRLAGNEGTDYLDGGAGNDRLDAGVGGDVLTGGDGADRFMFDEGSSATAPLGATRITDFDAGEGDSVNLRDVDANMLTADVNDKFLWIGTSAFHGVAGEMRISINAVDNIAFLQGDRDGDRLADFVIRFDAPVGLDLPGAVLV